MRSTTLRARSCSIAHSDTGFGYMEETVVDVGMHAILDSGAVRFRGWVRVHQTQASFPEATHSTAPLEEGALSRQVSAPTQLDSI